MSIAHDIITKHQFYESEEETGKLRTYFIPYYLFDFFNKISVFIPNDNSFLLVFFSQNYPHNCGTYVKEIIKLVDDISEFLGNDVKNLGTVAEEEFKDKKWKGRIWKKENITYKLILNDKIFQFYIES